MSSGKSDLGSSIFNLLGIRKERVMITCILASGNSSSSNNNIKMRPITTITATTGCRISQVNKGSSSTSPAGTVAPWNGQNKEVVVEVVKV